MNEREKVTIKFCNEVNLGFRNNFENNVQVLKGVIVDLHNALGVVILKDVNPQHKIEHDIIVPHTNVASYWIWENVIETTEVTKATVVATNA